MDVIEDEMAEQAPVSRRHRLRLRCLETPEGSGFARSTTDTTATSDHFFIRDQEGPAVDPESQSGKFPWITGGLL